MEFFNTINETGNELKELHYKAGTQNEKILEFFKNDPGGSYSAWVIHFLVFDSSVPITSVRRALTTLVNDGALIKTMEKKKGPYGVANYLFKLK